MCSQFLTMIYEDWAEYQAAIQKYERALASFNKAQERWTADCKDIQEGKDISGSGCLVLLVAMAGSVIFLNWIAGIVLGAMVFVGVRQLTAGRRIQRYKLAHPVPVFNQTKPEFRPADRPVPSESRATDIKTPAEARELLGLGAAFSENELKTAYRQGIRDYHPDQVANLGSELRALAEAKTKQINQAYELLVKYCASTPEQASPREKEPVSSADQNDPFRKSPIYAEHSIICADIGDDDKVFIKGPFEVFEGETFCDPYEIGVDVREDFGREYLTINSWKGRLRHGTEPGSILSSELFELAERGGWDGDHNNHEVWSGGADVIPAHDCRDIAKGLRLLLAKTHGDLSIGSRSIARHLVEAAIQIFEAGPTTIPW